ncbi:MAG: sugar phosphate isomerase/epimerase [Clostridia bacterium]|nr:sugar phosphate isomerase/epimerase [Clostridia bacterium]
MRTGICTTDFEVTGQLPKAADRLFGRIAELGFECVQFAFSSIAESEFTPTGRIEIPDKIPTAALDAAARSANRYHLPIEVINGTFNMAHPDEDVRREGIKRFALLTEAAEILGAKYISLCSGTRFAEHLWTYSPDNHTAGAWNDMLDTIQRAVELAERRNITLAIESEASNIIDTPENARRVMDEVGSDHLKMILDCANLFHIGRAHPEYVQETIAHAFEFFGEDIVLAHGKDIREGDGINFCGTGRGIVDFPFTAQMLKKYGFAGDMFLHGIYDEADMPFALAHWKAAEKAAE